MKPRARRTALMVLLTIVVVVGAVAWYALGEARRTGRLIGQLLSARLGVPVTVDAAVVQGTRLRLHGVAVAGPPVTGRAERIDVNGGMLALVSPSGRRLSIVIVEPSVRLVRITTATDASTGAAGDVISRSLRGLFGWSGDVELTVEDAELRLGAANATPIMASFVASYDARQTRLAISRYSLGREPDIRLEGQIDGRPSGSGLRFTGTARGEIAGSPLDGRASWETASGRFSGEVALTALDVDRMLRRLELGAAPARAQRVTARFAGTAAGPRSDAAVQARAEQIQLAALPGAVLGATLDARLAFDAGGDSAGLTRVDAATLTVLRDERPLLLATAASPPTGLWPLALEVTADDVGRLAAVLPALTRLSGQGRFRGEFVYGERLTGRAEVTVPEAQVHPGGPVLASGVRASVPVSYGPRASVESGTVALARLSGMGLIVRELTGAAEMVDGRLLLRDLRYLHAGGRGGGWLEVIPGAGAPPSRARLDAEGVDLAVLLSETGWQIGRITGRIRYTVTAQYPGSGGYVALLRANSEEGGEVSIDAVQRLVESAKVQAESNVVLHQTLENLRVFSYESLTAEVRVSPREARLDLSLVGRKRLGIFPAAVEAINLRNVPLTLLARTFAKGVP